MQPDELVDFALAYFTRLKAKRNAIAAENNNLSDESMLSEDEEFGECDTAQYGFLIDRRDYLG